MKSYTKEQIKNGMIKYYNNINTNPDQYDMTPEFNEEQAILSAEELIQYMDE